MQVPAGGGSPEQTNTHLRRWWQRGQLAPALSFDFPTRLGLDSDAPRALGEVGRGGVAVDTVRDVESIFRDLPIEQLRPSLAIDGPALVLFGFYLALADARGVPRSRLAGATRNDGLAGFLTGQATPLPLPSALRVSADLIAFCAAEVPRWDAASINGYALREAGASPSQEIAFALASALACVARCQQRGADPAAVAPHVSLTLAVHSDFFEEIAKFRAARRLWARALRERHGVTSPAALELSLHARTAGSTLAASQPGNNTARVAVQALAATLAGARSLHASSLDEMYAAPSDESITLALRTQQIIGEECRVGAVGPTDPLSGSALVEQLTDRLEAEAQAHLDLLDAQGGLLAAIALGHPQRALAEGRELQRRQLEQGERVVVGVNRHVDLVEPRNLPTLSLDEPTQRQQIDELRRLRRERDPGLVRDCLDEVSAASGGDANLLPPVIRAARALCTEQEICAALVNPG